MKYPYAVFSTLGGGLVRRNGSTFVFVVKPDHDFAPDLKVGDRLPDGWEVKPANQGADQDVVEHPEDFRNVLCCPDETDC